MLRSKLLGWEEPTAEYRTTVTRLDSRTGEIKKKNGNKEQGKKVKQD
jgi:hypothetical protein